jgi:diguanylate cyclase (GGDEF)-like protein/PAS domain S-box-containing protein
MDQVGYSEKELMNMTPLDIKPEFDETQFRKHVAPLLNGSKTSLTFQTIHRHKNGTDIPVEIILQHISPHGEEPRFVAIVRDITERKRAEEALADQAIRDSLTGLYNRRYFKTRIKEEIALADRNRQIINFLICDLDGFKSINDNLGHQAGDNVLIKVSKILLDCVRGSDLVFRWGGDEFVVILPDTDRDGLLVVINRIRRSIQQLSITGCTGLDISLGVSVYPEHGATEEELIGLADRALYIAKKGGEKIHIGEEEYRLDDQAIKVVFQPIMDVRLKQFVGFEALSRDPQGKHSILALFKKYHAIGKLHELKCLCFHKQLKAGHEFRVENLFINVDFNVLKSIEVPPKPPGMDVVLEISEEEALQNVEEHLEIAAKWRSKGFKFAIDDFGAGFVSLPFIARLIPDHVKLDRSTILQAVSSERFRLVLQDLVHALRNTSTDGIIAEGIETEKELQVMKDMGVYLIQGYIFGKPQELHGPLIKP